MVIPAHTKVCLCKYWNRRPFRSTCKEPISYSPGTVVLSSVASKVCFHYKLQNPHWSSQCTAKISNAKSIKCKAREKCILSSSMASRALLSKQPILSVMHQVYHTNTSRSCCQLLTQSSLPWDPSKTTTFTSELPPHLFQDSRRKQGGENAEPVRPVLFTGHKRP